MYNQQRQALEECLTLLAFRFRYFLISSPRSEYRTYIIILSTSFVWASAELHKILILMLLNANNNNNNNNNKNNNNNNN